MLEEREARKEAEKATAIAEERAAKAAVEEEEEEEEEEVDDGFARLRAELEKREEEKKKQKPNRSGWAFVGKRKEPEKEEKETLDEDDEEEENDSDIIPTQQIGDDDDEMQDADVIDSQPREKSNNVRGGFFKFFGNKTPSVAQDPVKQPSPTRSRENVRISSPREGGDDDGDDLPQQYQMQIDDDEDEPTAFNEQKIALVPMVVQQQSYQSPPKPQQPKRRVQSPPQQHQYHHHQRSSPPQQAARRVTGRFSEEEVLAVIRGVETYGLGKWKLIRESSAGRRPPRPNARGHQRQVPKLEIFRFEARFNRRRPEKCELPVRRGTLREGEKGGRGCALGGERLPSYLVKRERETQFSLIKADKYITHTHTNL